jgi:flagellar basal-body rod protein FlgC
MSNAINIALTALSAFEKKNDVIANNIANVNTDGFKKSRATMAEADPSGVKPSVERVNTPGDIVTLEGAPPTTRETSNVSTEEEIIALDVNTFHYEANLKAVETAEEMQGTLFDLFG